jgi:uracil-DNA glycosylase family 4
MENNSNKEALFDKILHCQNKDCHFYNEKPGFYPRFAYGNPDSQIMIVFQNPGAPTKERLKDAFLNLKNIKTVTLEDMRREAHEGVSNWLKGENKNFKGGLFELNGKGLLESFYITQSYKCPDPRKAKEISGKERKEVRMRCKEYLQQEIELTKPKVILAVGTESLFSIAEIFDKKSSIKEGIKALFQKEIYYRWEYKGHEILVFPIVHPDGIWRNPPIDKSQYQNTVKKYLNMVEQTV